MKCDFLGLDLKNPILVAAGPWARDGASIAKCLAAGAGAVVTESIVSDTVLDVRPRLAYDGFGAQIYVCIRIFRWKDGRGRWLLPKAMEVR